MSRDERVTPRRPAWSSSRPVEPPEIPLGGPLRGAVSRHGHLSTTRLSDGAVARMVKRRAQQAGVDGDFAAHSLRSGFATEAYAQGTPEMAIMRHGRWRSTTVMRGYVEEGGVWNDNAAQRLGL